MSIQKYLVFPPTTPSFTRLDTIQKTTTLTTEKYNIALKIQSKIINYFWHILVQKNIFLMEKGRFSFISIIAIRTKYNYQTIQMIN